MKCLLRLEEIGRGDAALVGGKAFSLRRLQENEIRVPQTFCVPCTVYETYLAHTGIKEKILFRLNRKPMEQMRWEEIWDVSLYIRNLFVTVPFPPEMKAALGREILEFCGDRPHAVRSSAPGEDDRGTSFAGLHASFLNVAGAGAVLDHIKLVWASLFSDGALLYRKELSLNPADSRMAVVIQEMIPSDNSGVFFSISPSDSSQAVLEAVHGLNQGLVDGRIEPDRWIIDRASGRIVDHVQPERLRFAAPDVSGERFRELPEERQKIPPLNSGEIRRVVETGKKAEEVFSRPQDMEWTFHGGILWVLQSRPVTSSGFQKGDDKRSWYLSLHRSFENLKSLQDRIENRLIPEMIRQADRMGQTDLGQMTAEELAGEIRERQAIYDHWVKVYWADFIPFAHGIRLFGQVYNDAVKPEDPYDFMALLENTGLYSIERNRLLEELAGMIRTDPQLESALGRGNLPEDGHPFTEKLSRFIDRFGDLACQTGEAGECHTGAHAVIRILMQMAKRPMKYAGRKAQDSDSDRVRQYLSCFPESGQEFAKEVLRLGRASFRLRDDDNIHLGRIETRLFEVVNEGRIRLSDSQTAQSDREILSSLPSLASSDEAQESRPSGEKEPQVPDLWVSARQIVGHPAGPGIAKGTARVILHPSDLLDFRDAEVLVCASVDPNMTFVVPLASAVVEERGGMLIHGAIIAREYGLPCITGAPEATQLIQTGDTVTVDGYLGILTCDTGPFSE